METLLCLKNLMQRLPEVIKSKISLENMKTKIMVFMMIVIQTDYTDEDDEDQHYSRKKASLILGKFLLVEPIGTYKTLSMKVYNIQ